LTRDSSIEVAVDTRYDRRRPFVCFDLYHSNGQPLLKGLKLWALVDSGADVSVFPRKMCFLDRQGHDFEGATARTSIGGVSSVGTMFELKGLQHTTIVSIDGTGRKYFFLLRPFYVDRVFKIDGDKPPMQQVYDRDPIFGMADFFRLFRVQISSEEDRPGENPRVRLEIEPTAYGKQHIYESVDNLLAANSDLLRQTHPKLQA